MADSAGERCIVSLVKQTLIYTAILFVLVSLCLLILWHWTQDPRFEPVAEIFATMAVLPGLIDWAMVSRIK